MSINAIPLLSPIKAYSVPSSGSVQPQESFPEEALRDERVKWDCKSYPSQGKLPAIPLEQGVWDNERSGTKNTIDSVNLNMDNWVRFLPQRSDKRINNFFCATKASKLLPVFLLMSYIY